MTTLQALWDFESNLREWVARGVPALHEGPLSEGPWVEMLARAVEGAPAAGTRAFVHPGEGAWRFEPTSPLPTLEPGAAPSGAALDAVLPSPRAWVPVRTLLWLRRCGVSHCWIFEDGTVSRVSLATMLAELLFRRKLEPRLNRVFPSLGLDSAAIERLGRAISRHPQGNDQGPVRQKVSSASEIWARELASDNEQLVAGEDPRRPLKIVQYIGSLSSGGAERQLCNLALGLHAKGHDVRVRTSYAAEGSLGHYQHLLAEDGIDVGVPADIANATGSLRWDLLAAAPGEIRQLILPLALELANDPPDVLHAWLDHPNIIAGLAGIVAQVPVIALSTRNANPTNFPRLYAPYLKTWYRVLRESRRVHWIANSHNGARSYADWLKLPVSKFNVILNGLFDDHFDPPSEASRAEARKAFDLSERAPVVAVINRLSEEKQPELMLRVVRLLRSDLPDLRVLVAGVGPLEERLWALIARHGLQDCVRLIGRLTDVTSLLHASDALLLTSTLEGCPNVALEAQHLGVPVVATAGGGTVDAVVDGRTGFLRDVDDAAGLALSLRRVLVEPGLRQQLGANAQRFVETCFSNEQMVDLHQRLYRNGLRGHGERLVTPKPCLADTPEVGMSWAEGELHMEHERRERAAWLAATSPSS